MSRARSERRGFDKILFDQHVLRVRTMKGATDCGPPRAHPLGNKAELDKVWILVFGLIRLDNCHDDDKYLIFFGLTDCPMGGDHHLFSFPNNLILIFTAALLNLFIFPLLFSILIQILCSDGNFKPLNSITSYYSNG